MSNKRVLFVENFKIFEKWASKTYPFKCQKIKEDPRFEVYDFGSGLVHIEPLDYDVLVFGWHAVSINKYYTTKQSFYSKYVDMLEEQCDVDDILEPLLSCKDVVRYVVVQDLHEEDYKGLSFCSFDLTTNETNHIQTGKPLRPLACLSSRSGSHPVLSADAIKDAHWWISRSNQGPWVLSR